MRYALLRAIKRKNSGGFRNLDRCAEWKIYKPQKVNLLLRFSKFLFKISHSPSRKWQNHVSLPTVERYTNLTFTPKTDPNS